MTHTIHICIAATLAMLWACPPTASGRTGGDDDHGRQQADRVQHTLSAQEDRYHAAMADVSLASSKTLHANPASAHLFSTTDTARHIRRAMIYAATTAARGEGDFLPYEGRGSADRRIGAYGEHTTPHSGTLSGSLQYAQGTHRNIGWSAMRLPELYLPYISTDSCGGHFRFDCYYAEGGYGFAMKQWTLGAKASFYGEQAHRLTDPRALNTTTWLRFGLGAARHMGSHLLMLDAGYGRNKQHMRLRYWRPGQQDRFFVCYGFGLYDTRQSGVAFGKSRMYYVDELSARLQYLSPRNGRLRLHASLAYDHDHMKTEESDIYNLYESRTHRLSPLLRLTYAPQDYWHFDLMATADIALRKGYENIIEEYLIDKDNNIYDFRTIDTRQNYSRNTATATAALRAARQCGSVELSMQGGLTADRYDERYKRQAWRIGVRRLTPHVMAGACWQGRRDVVGLSLLYARQHTGSHHYNVSMQNSQLPHLDFQQAFAPYAYRCANLHKVAVSATWQHRLGRMDGGMSARCYMTRGNRIADVSYTGDIGFASSAPMIQPAPDTHREQWGELTVYLLL